MTPPMNVTESQTQMLPGSRFWREVKMVPLTWGRLTKRQPAWWLLPSGSDVRSSGFARDATSPDLHETSQFLTLIPKTSAFYTPYGPNLMVRESCKEWVPECLLMLSILLLLCCLASFPLCTALLQALTWHHSCASPSTPMSWAPCRLRMRPVSLFVP